MCACVPDTCDITLLILKALYYTCEGGYRARTWVTAANTDLGLEHRQVGQLGCQRRDGGAWGRVAAQSRAASPAARPRAPAATQSASGRPPAGATGRRERAAPISRLVRQPWNGTSALVASGDHLVGSSVRNFIDGLWRAPAAPALRSGAFCSSCSAALATE